MKPKVKRCARPRCSRTWIEEPLVVGRRKKYCCDLCRNLHWNERHPSLAIPRVLHARVKQMLKDGTLRALAESDVRTGATGLMG